MRPNRRMSSSSESLPSIPQFSPSPLPSPSPPPPKQKGRRKAPEEHNQGRPCPSPQANSPVRSNRNVHRGNVRVQRDSASPQSSGGLDSNDSLLPNLPNDSVSESGDDEGIGPLPTFQPVFAPMLTRTRSNERGIRLDSALLSIWEKIDRSFLLLYFIFIQSKHEGIKHPFNICYYQTSNMAAAMWPGFGLLVY